MTVSIAADDLRKVFPTTLPDESLQVFIDAAEELVNTELATSGLSEERQTTITTFLAAHFAHTASPRAASEDFDGYKYTGQGKTGMDLKATFYGQNALLLDTSGKLAALGTRKITIHAYKPDD